MTNAISSGAGDMSDREIVLSRAFDAPRELVWEAMTDPAHVVKWWGPHGFSTTIEEMDMRPGGVWKHVMRGPDGTEYPNKSVFIEVVRPERIRYSHGGGTKGKQGVHFESTWTFDALDDGQTRVTIRMVFSSADDRERVVRDYGAIEGGKQTLARLGELLAQEPVVIERTFAAPIETVWKAITDSGEMKHWYFKLEVFQPEVGFATTCSVRHNGQDFVHLFRVTEVVLGRKLVHGWKYRDHEGESFVTWELFPAGEGTRLRLTHAGLETFRPDTYPDYRRGNFVKGWTSIVGTALAKYLEQLV